MNRQIVAAQQQPRALDFLTSERATMINFGHLARMVLGTGTLVDGLACTQTTVPSMQVQVGPGCITFLTVVDGSAYGSMASDSNALVKVGINEGTTSFTLTAPGTAGQSINYLIEAQFSESDTNSTTLTFLNTGTGLPYTASANTTRQQIVSLQVKNGTAATTGTQTTPSVDSGWTGLYVVTVAYGATSVINANISTYAGAPFLAAKLPALLPLSGTLGGISATQIYAGNPNGHVAGNTASGSLPPDTCWDSTNLALYTCTTTGNAGAAVWRPITPPSGAQQYTATGAFTFTVPAGVYLLKEAHLWAAGGGGSSGAGGSGGAGEYLPIFNIAVTPGQTISGSVGTGGTSAVNGATAGNGGNTTFNSQTANGGGGGGAGPGTGGTGAGGLAVAGQAGMDLDGTLSAVRGGYPAFWNGAGQGGDASGLTSGTGAASAGQNGKVIIKW
jgi:hypothetical protein